MQVPRPDSREGTVREPPPYCKADIDSSRRQVRVPPVLRIPRLSLLLLETYLE
jgi:hypothetical protein